MPPIIPLYTRMQVTSISILNIHWVDSPFKIFSQSCDKTLSEKNLLKHSILENGIFHPIWVYPKDADTYFLVHGWQRLTYAIEWGWKEIPALVFFPQTPPVELLKFLWMEFSKNFTSSILFRARFLKLTKILGIQPNVFIETFLPLFLQQPHTKVYKNYEKILELPEVLLIYGEEKKFSLKQYLQFFQYPRELLLEVLFWKTFLPITTGFFLEFLENLQSILKRKGIPTKSIPDFLKNTFPEIYPRSLPTSLPHTESFLDPAPFHAITPLPAPQKMPEVPTWTPLEKTNQLRKKIKSLAYPTFTALKEQMQGIQTQMKLPRQLKIQWDESLENQRIELKIHLENPEELGDILNYLQTKECQQGIQELFQSI